jgi:hypothetical protein
MKYCQHYGCRKQAKQRFCSVACRVAFHNARRPAAEKIKITCGACGKVFSGRPDQKTCSATCRSRLFRNRHAASTPDSVSARGAAFEWSRATPFSPAELRRKMQHQTLAPGVAYSWLPEKPAKVRTRAAQANTDQLLFDFTADRAAPDPSLEASD